MEDSVKSHFDYWKNSYANIPYLIRKTSALFPDRVALIDGEMELSYSLVDELSDLLASYLVDRGVGCGSYVAIFMDRSFEYILSSIAIIKSGAAYIPLELSYPKNLLTQIFNSAKPKAVLTKRDYLEMLDGCNSVNIEVQSIFENRKIDSSRLKNIEIESSNCAILGYTSGTTGEPKGVLVSHKATMYAHAKFWEESLNYGEVCRFAFSTFLAWDALSPFQYGATAFIVPQECSYDTRSLANFIEKNKIDHTVFTPSLLQAVLKTLSSSDIKKKFRSLNLLWIGGEVLTPSIANRILEILPNLNLVNNYGPVECFVITQGRIKLNDKASQQYCPVGKILDGMDIKLLDENMKEVSKGEMGELYASGPCIADGYFNNKKLTNQKFININGKIFYKTEDMAYFVDDGRLVVKGRKDFVVKLRGYHINLKYIEEILIKNNKISDCIVLSSGNKFSSEYLAAFYMVKKNNKIVCDKKTGYCAELINFLKRFIPTYMIPSIFIEIENIPIDKTSGKLDKKILIDFLPIRKKKKIIYPDNIKEKSINKQIEFLCNAAKSVIGLDNANISADTNLFEIGLHSLLAVEFAIHIEKAYNKEISVEQIYRNLTISNLVDFLNNQKSKTYLSIIDEAKNNFRNIIIKKHSTKKSAKTINILLTGATGYLGVHILYELLENSSVNIYCLIRNSELEAYQRLKNQMLKYKLWKDEFKKNIFIINGDISKLRLGLSQKDYDNYAKIIDVVIHNAAYVNMIYPYEILKKINVFGTVNIINFSFHLSEKKLHYISTLGIFPQNKNIICKEDSNIDYFVNEVKNGYAQSKWVCEKIISNLIDAGYPIWIYRPGNIAPSTKTFLANPNDAQLLLLNACRSIRFAPQNDNWLLESSPVNFIAEIISNFIFNNISNNYYNISTNQKISANEIFQIMINKNQIDDFIPLSLWKKRVLEYGVKNSISKLKIIADTIDFEIKYMEINQTIEMNNLNRELKFLGLKIKETNTSLLINGEML